LNLAIKPTKGIVFCLLPDLSTCIVALPVSVLYFSYTGQSAIYSAIVVFCVYCSLLSVTCYLLSILKIAIDASRYGRQQSTGVEKYSFEIINRIYKLATDLGHDVRLYVRDILPDFPQEHQIVIKRRRLWTIAGLSLKMLFGRPDVLFVPSHVLPLIRPKRSAIMIHDIAFKRYPKVYTLRQRLYLNWSTKYAVRHATTILVPSEFTSNELQEVYKCPKSKIHVVHHGVSKLPPSDDKYLHKFGLTKDDKYVIFIGRIEYKKNLSRLVRAFSSLPHRDWKLVLVGKGGYGAQDVFDAASTSDARDRIIFTDYVNEEEKSCLLNNASLFAFPSLYEGFGLPVLEAFLTKTPVLVSDIPVLREVGMQACYGVQPLDESDIAQGLDQMIRDLSMRERMVKMGTERLLDFDWDKAAKQTFEILIQTKN